jgi:hypothetical protein
MNNSIAMEFWLYISKKKLNEFLDILMIKKNYYHYKILLILGSLDNIILP